jgi:F0F1-type ATP synthase assembly protein I
VSHPGGAGEAAVRDDAPDAKEMGYYLSLAQVGMEMVAPMGVGIAIDYYFETKPWATVIGAVFGFTAGLFHLIVLANRPQKGDPGQAKRKAP